MSKIFVQVSGVLTGTPKVSVVVMCDLSSGTGSHNILVEYETCQGRSIKLNVLFLYRAQQVESHSIVI